MQKPHLTLLIACAILAIASSQNFTNFTCTYKTVGDLDLKLDVYIPSQTPYAKYPVFFAIHGGGYMAYSKSGGLTQAERAEVLSLGCVYITIDYRLLTGVFLSDIVQDVQDAYNWVRNELSQNISIDLDAMVVWGSSAGGGLALIGGYTFTPRPKAIIAFYPCFANFTDAYVYNPATPVNETIWVTADLFRTPVISEYTPTGTTDPRAILFYAAIFAQKFGWLAVSSNPTEPADQVLASLSQFSTVEHVDENYPPTMLVHGLNDSLIPYNQSIMMANVFNATNIDYVLELVPGADHAFDSYITNRTSQEWEDYIQPVFDFAMDRIGSVYDIISV